MRTIELDATTGVWHDVPEKIHELDMEVPVMRTTDLFEPFLWPWRVATSCLLSASMLAVIATYGNIATITGIYRKPSLGP